MRLHHAEKTAGTLPIDTPEREHAKTVIVTEILHWRIWNGKAKDARITLERIRQVISEATATGKGIRRHAGCGRRCARSAAISPARAPGWSTMPSAIVPVCGSARRSRKAPPTSWSTAA